MFDGYQLARRQRVLADFGEFALRSENLDEILAEACRLVGEAMGTGRAKILEIEHKDRTLLVRAGVGWQPDIVGRLRLPMEEHSSETYSIGAGRPVVTRDIGTEDRFEVPAFMREAGVVAMANVPIFLPGGQAYGLLQVDAAEPRDFGDEDTEFLRTYATILGPVIDRLHKIHKLRATEERFRLIVENARDYAIFVTDPQGRITDWMPGAEAVFGWTAEEAAGQPGSVLFTPEDRTNGEDGREIETARAAGVAPDRRWHLRKDGARVFIEGTVTALRSDRGELRGFLKIGQDVTERRRTEERLRAGEERLRRVLETEAVGVLIFDRSGTVLDANDAFLRMTGYTRAEVASRDLSWRRMTPPEWVAASEAEMDALATKGRVGPYEKEYILSDGSRRWMLFAGRDLGDGTVCEYCIDVTGRKRAETALRESEARFRALATAGTYMAYRMSPDWRRMHQLDGRDVLADTPEPDADWADAYLLPEDRPAVFAAVADAIRSKSLFELEHRVRRADGSVGWVLSRAVPMLGPEGKIVEWFGAATDVTERRTARERLRESEARLAAVFEVLPVGVGVFDTHGGLILSNQEMQRFMPTGVMPSRDEARRSRWRARRPDGRPVEPQDFPGARALRGERVVPGIEMLHADGDGREVWTNISAVPLRGHGGRVTGAAVMVADVDALKRGAEALRGSEARFRQFGECSTDILWIRGAGTLRYEYVSPAFEAIYGTNLGELMAGDDLRGWAGMIHPEDREGALDNLREVRGGERVTHEFRIRRPDDEERWIRNTDFPLLDGAGRVQRVAGIGQDVTGLKRAEAALRESEQRLSTLVEGVPQLVWRAMAGGRWTWSSPQWTAFTGLSEEESRGRGWLEALHPDDRGRAMQAWAEADHSAPLRLEARIFNKAEHRYVWFGMRATPVRDEQGQAVEWLGTSTDIDDLKRLQGQQQVLVAELQHCTRNLLAVVRGVARRGIPPSPGRDEYDARLAALGRVQGFLSRSSLYAVPLADLLEAELAAAGDGASERVTVGGPPVALPGEGVQAVALALHELATNAVKYGAIAQPSGRLAVTWRLEGDDGAKRRLVINWRESGVAMPGGGGPPTRRGYGTELITEALPYQLNAQTELEFMPDGVRCRIALPAGALTGGKEEAHA